jgi:hypothetical protein
MLIKIPSCRHELQPQSNKTSVKTRRNCHGGLTANQDSTRRRVRRAIVSCGGVCDWEVSRLASFCGISPRQFTRDMAAIAPRWIIKIERKGPDGKNLTNLLMLPALPAPGMGDKNGGEKLELLTPITTTPARENPRTEEVPPVELPKPAPVREAWEARRAQDREDHHRMRERYDAVGRDCWRRNSG